MSLESAPLPFPKRAELHGSVARHKTLSAAKPKNNDWFRIGGAVAVSGLLAAAAVLPGSGGAAAADARADSGTDTGSVPTSHESSWGTVKTSSTGTLPAESETSWANLSSPGLKRAGELAEAPAAASRARLRTPLTTTSCAKMPTAANGARNFTELSRVYIPLEEGTFVMSSPFGYRFHPITGEYKLHEGTDFQAPEGTPIHAVDDGTVTFAGYDGGAGYKTVIQHVDTDGSMVETWYYHQLAGSQLVAVGDKVTAGQTIGAVGTTGNSTGAHLHLEVHPNGGPAIDPDQWLKAHEAVFLGQECK